jgi:diamine N-acetyltransferase
MSDLLYLRIPRSEDVDFMLRLENDPDIWKVSQTEDPFTYNEIADFINDSKHNLFLEFQLRNIIVLKEGDVAVGTLDLFDYNAKERSAGIGITICKEHRNKRIGSQALSLFVKMLESKNFMSIHISMVSFLKTMNQRPIKRWF